MDTVPLFLTCLFLSKVVPLSLACLPPSWMSKDQKRLSWALNSLTFTLRATRASLKKWFVRAAGGGWRRDLGLGKFVR